MKKHHILLLTAALLIWLLAGCGGVQPETETFATAVPTEATAATEVTADSFAERSEHTAATVITASDFQDNGTFFRFGMILETIAEAGCPTPDCVLLGGDYSMQTGMDPDNSVRLIRENLADVYPDFLQENAIFIQGNHDNATAALTPSGAHDMGSFTVYSINEDEFPSGQSAQDVQETARALDEFLSGRIAAEDYRPVLVATHVPLHHNSRCDNGGAKYLVDVLNRYGQTLDILVLFGHNHSGAYDDGIGGSVNFFARGETMKVHAPEEPYTETGGFTEVTLNFTYLNYGYVGYSNNTTVSELTVGVIRLCPDSIEITRFTMQGEYCHYSVPLLHTDDRQKAA